MADDFNNALRYAHSVVLANSSGDSNDTTRNWLLLGSSWCLCRKSGGVGVGRVGAVVLEAVQVLVALSAVLAAVGLLLLHTQCTGIGGRSLGVNDGEGSVGVVVELLVGVTMLF
jgi:hypothetical protein